LYRCVTPPALTGRATTGRKAVANASPLFARK
jgi:hypothetical protein